MEVLSHQRNNQTIFLPVKKQIKVLPQPKQKELQVHLNLLALTHQQCKQSNPQVQQHHLIPEHPQLKQKKSSTKVTSDDVKNREDSSIQTKSIDVLANGTATVDTNTGKPLVIHEKKTEGILNIKFHVRFYVKYGCSRQYLLSSETT